MRRALADFTPQHGLSVGSPVPTVTDVRTGIAAIEYTLVPATRQQIAECVAKLAVGFNFQQTKDEARARVEVWVEANGDLPHDLLVKGTKALLQSYQFGMPKPSNLREIIAADLADRRQQFTYARMLLEVACKRAAEPPRPREPVDVRIKGLRDSFRKIGKMRKAAGYERSLAEIEGREVAEWARDVAVEQAEPAKPDDVKLPPLSKGMQGRTLLSLAKSHRKSGNEAYAERLEQQAYALSPDLRPSP